MIAFLRGRSSTNSPTGSLSTCRASATTCPLPLSTFYRLGAVGAAVALHVHTHVREDALALYGFATALEQQIFERLIAISGIGPKLALAVLSGIEPPDLVRAVQAGDVARLTAIPGVGKKTAERIGLELQDRLPSIVPAPPANRAPSRRRRRICGATCSRRFSTWGIIDLSQRRRWTRRSRGSNRRPSRRHSSRRCANWPASGRAAARGARPRGDPAPGVSQQVPGT